MTNTNFLQYSKRIEINTPFFAHEKQHLVSIRGKWYSVFSFICKGRRKFKCREQFASDSAAASYWIKVTNNYA